MASQIGSQPLWDWINERHAIYLRKTVLEGSEPPAWADPKRAIPRDCWTLDHLTDDPVMSEYRFCNVFRELDRVTVWIRENIREPYADHPDLWFMLAIARYINWPPTLQFLMDQGCWPGQPNFSPALIGLGLAKWAEMGNKVYTGAYMIRAESDPNKPWYNWSKHRYIAEVVLGRLWEDRLRWMGYLEEQRPDHAEWLLNLQNTHHLFQDRRYIGWGPFMAYEVVTDMRHTRYLRDAPDIMTWANAGPGAIRGLNRTLGQDPKRPIEQSRANDYMIMLLELSKSTLASWVPPLEMRDIEHSLCEMDKWLRVKNGEGRPRAKYIRGRGY